MALGVTSTRRRAGGRKGNGASGTAIEITRIVNAIICDDIRIEGNKKHILIGVYCNNIITEQFPFVISVSLFIQFYVNTNGKTPIGLRILQEDKVLASHNGELTVHDARQIITISFGGFVLNINAPAPLRVQIKLGADWQTMRELTVERGLTS